MFPTFYAVIEIQINDGVPAAPPVIIKSKLADAKGEAWVKQGYAYQHPRDYTEVVIIDSFGNFAEGTYPVTIDRRGDATQPVFYFAEFQVNDVDPVALPVNVQVGDAAESLVMQAYHHALEYSWNVQRPYTLAFASCARGEKRKSEYVFFPQ